MSVPSTGPGGRAGSLREPYVRPENMEARTEAWLAAIRPFVRHGFHPSCPGARPCLLITDLQRFFLEEDAPGYLPAAEAVLPGIRALLHVFHDRGFPVIFTRHTDLPGDPSSLMEKWWGRAMDPEDPLCILSPALVPGPGDTVLEKHRYSAFQGTELEACLRGEGVTSVVVTGVMTHLCCESTARDAFQRGFPVLFPVDGTADLNEAFHLGALRGLAHGFAVPALAREVACALER